MWCDINVFAVRQTLLLCAASLLAVTSGITLAFSSVLNSVIIAPDGPFKSTSNQASWILACFGIGGMLSYTFTPLTFNIFGRKITNILSNLFILISNLMLFVATDIYMLAFARTSQGLHIAGTFIINITLSECISPTRRGYFTIIYKISLGVGSLACHGLGMVMTWRQIAIFGAVLNLLSIILLIICGESPSFFAFRGQFDKCAKAFEWYRGNSLNARKELKEFMSAQAENLRIKRTGKKISIFQKTKKLLKSKDFQKSLMIVTLATLCLDSCGRYFILAYISDIFMKVINNRSLAMHISVLSDLILIFALSASTFLVKYFNRRTLLFIFGYCSVLLMFMISLSSILSSRFEIFQNVKWLTPTLILLHTLAIHLGVVPIVFAVTSEIFSLEHRGVGTCFAGFIYLAFFNLVMILTPIMIDTTGIEGTYSIYGLCLFSCLVLLQITLPETKDKSLQQIENELKGINRNSFETELLNLSTVNK